MRNNDSTAQDESESDTSAESAAVARGAARTAATSTRGIVGRLPVQSSSSLPLKNIPRVPKRAPRMRASSPRGGIPKIRVPKSHGKVPKSHANTIAKASDRASKGFDVFSSIGDVNVDNNVTKKSNMQIKISQYIQQISSFGKVFITNTILGMAVFATYEGVVEYVTPPPSSDVGCDIKEDVHIQPNLQQEEQIDKETKEDDMDRATLPQHFFAGGLAGISHSILSLTFEIKKSDVAASKGRTTNPIHLHFPTFRYSSAYITHHSLAHSVLFGSYQTSKRMLINSIPDSTKDEENNDFIGHIVSITLAGGIAGQFQHVTSHLSEQCLGLVNERKNSTSLLRRLKVASWPSLRSTLLSFPPSAIGFLAFEYGKMVMISSDE